MLICAATATSQITAFEDTDRRIRIVKRQAGTLRNVTSVLGCVDGTIAPALSVMVCGAILMTIHRAYQAERGVEPAARRSRRPLPPGRAGRAVTLPIRPALRGA
jgi:hypothetical protein